MQSINRILVVLDSYEEATDREESLPVEVHKALRFVKDKQESEIILLLCGYEKFLHDSYYSFGDELKELREAHCKRLEETLAGVEGKLRDEGYRVKSELVWAYPRYEQIVKKSIDYSADLVIQHTRAYGKLARAFLTNDSWQLVRFCPKPLLLVKDRHWQERPVILAGVDPVHNHHKPLKLDHKIVNTALGTGAQLGGSVHVLHAYAEVGRPFALPDKVLQVHKDGFEGLLEEFNLPAENCHLVNESPVIALQKYEEDLGSDIIVMGALSRSRLSDALIGNTAEQVLDYLESDVLIVKPRSIT